MKPLKLSLQAFGSYVTRQEIDFERIARAPLFLIHGPTGAGKTTILDGICYALYGEASVSYRLGKHLRSQQADPNTTTEVSLDFSYGSKLYRVVRAPEQTMSKKRGVGTRSVPASASLYELDRDTREQSKLVCSKAREVAKHVTRLLGLNCEEFRQLILIPQGEFRRLLFADTAERKGILESLFRTERYRHLEQLLREAARELHKRHSVLSERRSSLLAHYELENEVVLRKRCTELNRSIETLSQREASLRQVLDTQRARVVALDQWCVQREQIKEIEQQLVLYRKRAKDIEVQRRKLANIERARELEVPGQLHIRLHGELVQLRTEQEQDQLLNKRELAQIESIQSLLAKHSQLSELATCLSERQTVLRACSAQVESLHLLEQSLSQFETDYLEASENLAKVKDTLKQLQSTRVQSITAELVSELESDQPCPVCGSREHPAPASVIGESVADSDLEHMQQQLARAAATVERLEVERTATRLGANNAISELGSLLRSLDLPALNCAEQLKLNDDKHRIKDLELPCAEIMGAEIDSLHRAVTAEVHSLLEQFGALVSEAIQIPFNDELAAPQVVDTQCSGGAKLEDISSVGARWGELRDQLLASSAARQVAVEMRQKRIEQLSIELDSLDRELNQRIAASSFSSLDEVLLVLQEFDQRDVVQDEVNQFDSDLAVLRTRQAELKGLVSLYTESDYQNSRIEYERTQSDLEETILETQRQKEQKADLSRLEIQLRNFEEETQRLDREYASAGRVADLVQGHNNHRLSLQSYVLTSLLDEVLYLASKRLQRMSRGRYEMRRSRLIIDRRSEAGLELAVTDHYTGYDRAVTTLSGGEVFLASLALALGLSDIVQAHAGGMRLDAMFIDEGFGTLDSEALDLALATVYDLQSDGRMIGLISHVPELRDRIDVRLEVQTGTNGSTAQFVLP